MTWIRYEFKRSEIKKACDYRRLFLFPTAPFDGMFYFEYS